MRQNAGMQMLAYPKGIDDKWKQTASAEFRTRLDDFFYPADNLYVIAKFWW